MRFVGIKRPAEFRTVKRAHVIAWREVLESRELAPATIRRKLSALSDLYNYLCDCNAVPHNPVNGVERPSEGANEGKTPALSDDQAAALLDAPLSNTLKGVRDRAFSSPDQSAHLPRCSTSYSVTRSTDQFAAVQQ
jgi:site-specific recombinase XerD